MKKIFVVFDSVSGSVNYVSTSANRQSFIRDVYPVVSRAFPLKDVKLFEVGEIDEQTSFITSCTPVEFSWSEYKFPLSQADNLSVFGDDVVKAFEETKEHQTEKKNIKSYDDLNKMN